MGTRPDYTDIGDDDIKELNDDQIREALYRVTESLKRILEDIDNRLEDGGL